MFDGAGAGVMIGGRDSTDQHSVSLSCTVGRDNSPSPCPERSVSGLSLVTVRLEFTTIGLSLANTRLDSFRGFHTGELTSWGGGAVIRLGSALAWVSRAEFRLLRLELDELTLSLSEWPETGGRGWGGLLTGPASSSPSSVRSPTVLLRVLNPESDESITVTFSSNSSE